MTIERERQLETFQFRIQTETNLMDDEITRLNNHLQYIEAEIIDAEDKYNNLSVKYDQKDQAQKGKEARTVVSKNALLNEIKSDYYAQMAKLGEEQTKQIQQIHNEFEEFFSQVEPWMNTKIDKEISPIEKKISAIRDKIERIRNTTVHTQDVDIKLHMMRLQKLKNLKTSKFVVWRQHSKRKQKKDSKTYKELKNSFKIV